MKLLTYQIDGVDYVGVMSPDLKKVYSLSLFGFPERTMQELIENMDDERFAFLKARLNEIMETSEGINYESVIKRAPIPRPRRDMICIGYNFKNHAEEIARLRGEDVKTAEVVNPIYFVKRVLDSTGDSDPIPYFNGYAVNLDVGVEVVVIIGKDALNISRDQVRDFIFGYTITNDVCDTRLNKIYTQPFLGKSMDGYMPTGPWIVTADEFEGIPSFDLRLSVNGDIRQEGNTSSLVFDIPYIVSQLTQNMTLKAGTMISTGSPANKYAGYPEKLLLLPGDVVECEISGIGKLSNYIEER